MNLYQQIERLGDMIKEAKTNVLELDKPDFVNKIPKPPKLTSLANNSSLNKMKTLETAPTLKTTKGAKKPLFTSEMKDNSPYNER